MKSQVRWQPLQDFNPSLLKGRSCPARERWFSATRGLFQACSLQAYVDPFTALVAK